MSDKPITWSQGVAVVGGAFGMCCLGFLLLHGMIVTDRAEAMANLLTVRTSVDQKIDRLADLFETHRASNEQDIKTLLRGQTEIMAVVRK